MGVVKYTNFELYMEGLKNFAFIKKKKLTYRLKSLLCEKKIYMISNFAIQVGGGNYKSVILDYKLNLLLT